MMRIFLKIIWWFLLAGVVLMMLTGCSERAPEALILEDSTIVYPSKKADGISAKITFSSNYYKKSGRQSAIRKVFPLKPEASIYAVIELENRLKNLSPTLVFHLDWIGPDGKSFYLKQIDLLPDGSSSALVSSIAIAPENRPPGIYSLKVYLHRELIAEKKFELKDEFKIESPAASIVFYKNADKETGMLTGVDTIFVIKKKGILRAQVTLKNLQYFEDEELPVQLEWTNANGRSFYSKTMDYTPNDTATAITSSISITPDKREAGEYFMRVYLFEDLIGEKRFRLLPLE